MPAKDLFHQLVRTALEQEGWTITHDPYHIDLGFVDLYIDLGAERLIAAIKDNEKLPLKSKHFYQLQQFLNFILLLDNLSIIALL